MSPGLRDIAGEGLWHNNPGLVQLLGLCPLLAVTTTARNGTLIPTLRRFRELLFFFVSFGYVGDRRTLATPGAAAVPYGVAIAAGAMTAWLGWGMAL